MDKLQKLMKKKKGSEMSDMEKKAKMSVVGELRGMASEAMGDKLSALKTMGSKPKLKEGLEKAKQILGAGHDGYNEDPNVSHSKLFGQGTAEEEAAESPAEEKSEEDMGDEGEVDAHMGKLRSDGEDQMSEEELDAKLEHLMNLKRKIHAKKD